MSTAILAQYANLVDWSFVERRVSTHESVLHTFMLQDMSWSVLNRMGVDVETFNLVARRFPRKPQSWGIYDYERMKASRGWMSVEITQEIYAPRRVLQWIEAGNEVEDFRAYLA